MALKHTQPGGNGWVSRVENERTGRGIEIALDGTWTLASGERVTRIGPAVGWPFDEGEHTWQEVAAACNTIIATVPEWAPTIQAALAHLRD